MAAGDDDETRSLRDEVVELRVVQKQHTRLLDSLTEEIGELRTAGMNTQNQSSRTRSDLAAFVAKFDDFAENLPGVMREVFRNETNARIATTMTDRQAKVISWVLGIVSGVAVIVLAALLLSGKL